MDKIISFFLFIFLIPVYCLAQHTQEELAYISEINFIRTNPKAYAEYVKDYASKTRSPEEREIANKELIPLLLSMKPLPSYKISEELHNAAKNHPVDTVKVDMFHDLTFSWWKTPYNISENITYGKDIKISIVIAMIDYSSYSRGHRSNILNPTSTHISVKRVDIGNTNCRGDLLMGKAKIVWLVNFI